jgi:hypothetical protein
MAYVAPTTRADGYVVDATEWDQNVVDNVIALRSGALSVASQATGDVMAASSSTQLARVAPAAAKTALISNGAGVAPTFQSVTVTGQAEGDVIIANSTTSLKVVTPATAGHVLTSAGAATAPVFAAQTMSLLKANSGTTTAAGAENVDTFAITGLTAKDTLFVVGTVRAATQAVSTIRLYNSTDSVEITPINDQGGSGDYAANQYGIFQCNIRQTQSSATVIMGMTDLQNANNTRNSLGLGSSFTTAWTGAWTLALRHSGVVAGGTFEWSWAVYKIAGQ